MRAINRYLIDWKEEFMKELNKFAKQAKFNWHKLKKLKL